MSYEKPFKVETDTAIGFQSVNRFGANNAANRALMIVEHGDVEAVLEAKTFGKIGLAGGTGFSLGGAGNNWNELGHHNLTEIPRLVGQVQIAGTAAGAIVASVVWFGKFKLQAWRIDPGVYLVRVLDLSFVYGRADNVVTSDAAAVMLPPQVRAFNASGQAGLQVSTLALNEASGLFEPVDTTFALTIYGAP